MREMTFVCNEMDLDEDILNVPLKKPTKFKKKLVKGNSALRRTKMEDEVEQQDSGVSMANKKKFRTRQTFVKNQDKTINVLKWTIPAGLEQLVDSSGIDDVIEGISGLQEGAVLTAAEMEPEDEPTPSTTKYVPKLDDTIQQKISKKTEIDEMAHEYDDYNDYDTIEDKNATIKPDSLDEATEMRVIDEDALIEDDGGLYDNQIGNSDEETSKGGLKRIFQPLPIDKEVQRLENLIKSLELENTSISTQLNNNKSQLLVIESRRNRVLEQLNKLG